MMAAVGFSREVYAETAPTLAELQTARETALWIKSIETNAALAD